MGLTWNTSRGTEVTFPGWWHPTGRGWRMGQKGTKVAKERKKRVRGTRDAEERVCHWCGPVDPLLLGSSWENRE